MLQLRYLMGLSIIYGDSNMVYPYATLGDTTEVVHSEMGADGRVKVYIEKAVSIYRSKQ